LRFPILFQKLEVLGLASIDWIPCLDHVNKHLVLENGLVLIAEEHALLQVLKDLLKPFVGLVLQLDLVECLADQADPMDVQRC
jgi:hypothetical protein